MRLRLSLNIGKKSVFIFCSLFILAGAGAYLFINQANKNPLPENVKTQVSYKVLYPSKTGTIDSSSVNYNAANKVLIFNAKEHGTNIVFAQQQAPDAVGSGTDAYYPALGIHPYAQFTTSLGRVALTKFWQSGSLKPVGQSGVLATNGTFLIAHSEKNLTNAEWKDIFESLKITK
jgi:hypothetical protein